MTSHAPRDLAGYADRYASLPFEEVQVASRRAAVLEVLADAGARRVLEVGCGLEPLAAHARAFEAWTIVEPAAAFASAAREVARLDARVTVVEATIEAAAEDRLRPGDHDVILLSSLLHEVPSPHAVLLAVHALCGPDTLVHVNVPNATSLHRQLAVAMGLIGSVTEPSAQQQALQQPRIFDAGSLGLLLQATGFDVVARGAYLMKPFTHAQMQALLDGGTIDRRVLDGLHELGKKFPHLASEVWVNARRRGRGA